MTPRDLVLEESERGDVIVVRSQVGGLKRYGEKKKERGKKARVHLGLPLLLKKVHLGQFSLAISTAALTSGASIVTSLSQSSFGRSLCGRFGES